MRIAFLVPVMAILVMVFVGCAKNELPKPANPKYIGIQPVDEDQNGVIDEKDVQALTEKADNWFNGGVLPYFTKAGIEIKTDEDVYTEENTRILKNNLRVVEWEELTTEIDKWNKIKIQLEATKKSLDKNPQAFDSGVLQGLAYHPNRLVCSLDDDRLIELIGIGVPTYASKYRKMSQDMLYKLALRKVVKIEYDVQKTIPSKAYLAGYVYVGDTFINAELVAKGYAKVEPTPPNHKHDELFMKLEKEAKEKKRGIWAFTDEF